MIVEQDFLDQTVTNHLSTYDNIQKITTAPGDDYTTACLLDCNYFKRFYDADPKNNTTF